jgi:pimeloyl-ACP methyl ester carboxylesterase
MSSAASSLSTTADRRGRRSVMSRLAALVAAVVGTMACCATVAHGAAPATLQLGSQMLDKCADSPLAYCGRLPVPLDHARPAGPHISIAFRWYPASAPVHGAARRTVVPVEGGPGYPSIESVSYQSEGSNSGYSAMYGPLLARWNMLAIDNRGTGESQPLKCPALQRFSGPTGTEAFQQAAAGCAEALNHRWRYPDGSWVHASDLFSSTPAAQDMAAVIKALALPEVDLYGDSYGSFFAQVFAAHFPRLVRSVILDSTYQTAGLDPWYRSTVQSMPAAFAAACSRSQACAAAEPGSPWARIGELAQSLRARAISGRVPGPTGALQQVQMDVVGLVDLVSDAAEDTKIYRGLDAAARALLGPGHDPAPLLRLYAQREYEDEGYFSRPVREYSVELYVADACVDYPQLFDMSAGSLARTSQLAAAESALPASTFAPFSTSEWISQNENTEAFSVCLGWPSPTVAQPPTDGALPLFPPSLPVLVLGGEFDTWTPPVDAAKVLAQIGGHSRLVQLANSTHVVGEGDTECASALVQSFVARPQAIDSLDASCAPAVAPIHAVGVYPAQLSEQPPLQPSQGNGASTAELQVAAAAVVTAGDAVSRYQAIEAKRDRGLAGGSVAATQAGSLLTLQRDRLVPGVAVSGTVRLTPSPIAGDGQSVLAALTVRAAGVAPESLTASWTTTGADAAARVAGTAAKRSLSGTTPAP